MTRFIWESVAGIGPLFCLGLLVSIGFGLALSKQFCISEADARPRVIRIVEASAFFLMFSIFGSVTAYFLSLGLKEEGLAFVNPLVDTFATPLIALLTAGVGWVARNTSEGRNSLIVPAGVVCFLVVCTISYNALFLAKSDRSAETETGSLTVPVSRTPT